MLPEIIITADGSHSLYDSTLDEVYHSKNGAIAESRHVFLEAGLESLEPSLKKVRIFEVGFGTGLNALLTATACFKGSIQVEYLACEPLPVKAAQLERLNYSSFLQPEAAEFWSKIRQCPENQWVNIHDRFTLKVIPQKVQHIDLLPSSLHLIYFDAFAPSIQAELWTTEIFSKLYYAMEVNGVFVTYSARGSVRRNLIAAGFNVERLPGPAGKREMLRGNKSIIG